MNQCQNQQVRLITHDLKTKALIRVLKCHALVIISILEGKSQIDTY